VPSARVIYLEPDIVRREAGVPAPPTDTIVMPSSD
jgi:hypothetical protein